MHRQMLCYFETDRALVSSILSIGRILLVLGFTEVLEAAHTGSCLAVRALKYAFTHHEADWAVIVINELL